MILMMMKTNLVGTVHPSESVCGVFCDRFLASPLGGPILKIDKVKTITKLFITI